MRTSGRGLVVDAGYEICGASQTIACALTEATGCPVSALGLQDETKCLYPPYQNMAPDAERITRRIKKMLEEKGNICYGGNCKAG